MKKIPLEEHLKRAIANKSKITFLVGAGISAESGIPTFRGKEGYWKVGSVNYKPQEIGTYKMFLRQPFEVWKWFLFRNTVCRAAQPNTGHFALVEIEKMLGDKFALITQNVDGLHIRAGNTYERMFPIHGDLNYARCGDSCSDKLYPFPNIPKKRDEDLTKEEIRLLRCKKCGSFLRPHVLWFDEYYNEEFYKAQSALKVAEQTEVLFIIGTSGSTTLPHRIFKIALLNRAVIVVIDIESNVFSEVIKEDYEASYIYKATSGEVLPKIAQMINKLL
ncbi:SIR2 family NAD-dependent protein deacylase [Bernardetia sp.]|uniref:SIR2 family NAD-dependent protein deacylase n=1 Tax=Bernardetia sp. TaxID=1937974 RepID=UPI0025BD7E01|nr:Sir2 family NAD-dependent protein deacetylase [Bernardetia sp.]